AAADVAAFSDDLTDPASSQAWKELVDAVFISGDAPVLTDQSRPLPNPAKQVVQDIQSFDDFMFQFKTSAFATFEEGREGAGADASASWTRFSDELRNAAGALQSSTAKNRIGSAAPDARSLLLGAAEQPVKLDLSAPMPGAGWYPAEKTGSGWHRWTGPGPKFSLEFLLPDRPYHCKMVMEPHRPDNFGDFAVRLNDTTLEYKSDKANSQDGTLAISFVIPATKTGHRPVLGILTFSHAAVSRPVDHGGEDARRL